jgi:hypothetical protein
VGAVCGKAASTDLCGGREVTRVPTAKVCLQMGDSSVPRRHTMIVPSSNATMSARMRIVEEHVTRENEHNLDGIMDTFGEKQVEADGRDQRRDPLAVGGLQLHHGVWQLNRVKGPYVSQKSSNVSNPTRRGPAVNSSDRLWRAPCGRTLGKRSRSVKIAKERAPSRREIRLSDVRGAAGPGSSRDYS